MDLEIWEINIKTTWKRLTHLDEKFQIYLFIYFCRLLDELLDHDLAKNYQHKAPLFLVFFMDIMAAQSLN